MDTLNIAEIHGATKRYPGVVALRDMQIQIKPGEVHGLIGENGAGKSTLIKYFTGVHQVDQGTMKINGEVVNFQNPIDAQKAGIACVYQELNIVKLLSVTDNIFMGSYLKKSNGILDYETMHSQAAELMSSLGQDINVRTEAGKFGMGIQQMIEIARAIRLDAKLLIMDEPTSSLGELETKQLFVTINKLKAAGVAVIFVSHKLEELFEICDRVTVMRDGEYIITEDIEDLDNDKLITAMVGRKLEDIYPKINSKRGKTALSVRNLKSLGVVDDISFDAYRGEILGFSGLVGAGRTETFRLIFGADSADQGDTYIDGQKVIINSPQDAVNYKMGLLTEDRKTQGLILSQTIETNLILANRKRFMKGPMLQDRMIEEVSDQTIKNLQIKAPSSKSIVNQLSGGNQQKVVIGKWLNANIDIFVFDEPTRGIDVGAKAEVYNIMKELVENDKCVIMISSDLSEILGMSNRVIVMREGRILETISSDDKHFNQESIMKVAWGGKL